MNPRRKRALLVFFETIATTSSFIPRFRMVSIIPGMESRAPDLTERAKAGSLVAESFPDRFFRLLPAPPRPLPRALGGYVRFMSIKVSAHFGGDGEPRWHRQADARHFVEITRLCHPSSDFIPPDPSACHGLRSNKRSAAFSLFSPDRGYSPVISVLFDVRRADFRTVDLRLVAILRMRKNRQGNERAKVVSGVVLSTILKTRRVVLFRGQKRLQPTLAAQKAETSDQAG